MSPFPFSSLHTPPVTLSMFCRSPFHRSSLRKYLVYVTRNGAATALEPGPCRQCAPVLSVSTPCISIVWRKINPCIFLPRAHDKDYAPRFSLSRKRQKMNPVYRLPTPRIRQRLHPCRFLLRAHGGRLLWLRFRRDRDSRRLPPFLKPQRNI